MPLPLNLRRWGDGPRTALLLHGLGDGAFVWNHIAPVLAAHSAVVAVDLRGHGDSPHDLQARYEPLAYAEDVLEVLRSHVGGRRVTLIGHSLGATVAIHVASQAREQVGGLALIDGGPWLSPTALHHIHQVFLGQAWVHETVGALAGELRRRHPLCDPQLLERIAEHSLRPLPSGGFELKCDRRLLGAECPPNDAVLWEKLTTFSGPVLVIRGAASAVLGRSSAARMARELPGCRLQTVPLAGHMVMLDNPGGFLGAIGGFLLEISSSAAMRAALAV